MKRQLNVIRNAVAERFPRPTLGSSDADVSSFRASVIEKLKLDNPDRTEEHIANPVDCLYLPLFEYISSVMQSCVHKRPVFIGISAPQGAGKTHCSTEMLCPCIVPYACYY